MFMVYTCSVLSMFFFFKQKTAYEMRISDWSSDVCSSDLLDAFGDRPGINPFGKCNWFYRNCRLWNARLKILNYGTARAGAEEAAGPFLWVSTGVEVGAKKFFPLKILNSNVAHSRREAPV